MSIKTVIEQPCKPLILKSQIILKEKGACPFSGSGYLQSSWYSKAAKNFRMACIR